MIRTFALALGLIGAGVAAADAVHATIGPDAARLLVSGRWAAATRAMPVATVVRAEVDGQPVQGWRWLPASVAPIPGTAAVRLTPAQLAIPGADGRIVTLELIDHRLRWRPRVSPFYEVTVAADGRAVLEPCAEVVLDRGEPMAFASLALSDQHQAPVWDEPAVTLSALASRQHPDGTWGDGDERMATTSLALLAFMADGLDHLTGTHAQTIRRGLEALWTLRDPAAGASGRALRCLAFAEAFGMTKRESLRPLALAAFADLRADWDQPIHDPGTVLQLELARRSMCEADLLTWDQMAPVLARKTLDRRTVDGAVNAAALDLIIDDREVPEEDYRAWLGELPRWLEQGRFDQVHALALISVCGDGALADLWRDEARMRVVDWLTQQAQAGALTAEAHAWLNICLSIRLRHKIGRSNRPQAKADPPWLGIDPRWRAGTDGWPAWTAGAMRLAPGISTIAHGRVAMERDGSAPAAERWRGIAPIDCARGVVRVLRPDREPVWTILEATASGAALRVALP